MIHQSQICQSRNYIAYIFLNEVACAILMKLQIQFILLISFTCDTCCLLQYISTTSFSLSDSCDVFGVFVFEAHLMYNKINMSLWPCYQANILWLYYMNSLGYLVHSLVSILCVHVSLRINIFVISSTQKLIHIRDDTYLYDSLFIPCVLGGHAKHYT